MAPPRRAIAVRDVTVLILPEVKEFLAEGRHRDLAETLAELHPVDVADLLAHLEGPETASLLDGLPLPLRVSVFEHLPEDRQISVVQTLGRERMVKVIEEMSSDDRADLVKALPERTREELLPLLAQADRDDVAKLVSHAEGTAGALMSTEYTAIPADLTAGAALTHLQKVAVTRETIYYVYVTDAERRLVGKVSLEELVLAKPTEKVSDIMTRDVITCRVTDDQEEVARVVQRYDFIAVPIVDEGGRLVGLVTHDDVIDVVQAEATEDAHRMGAVQPLEAPYARMSLLAVARKRAGWLAVLFVAGILTALTIGQNEAVIRDAVLLVGFLPLIIAQGGNSGCQSATIVTRALALGEVRARDWLRVLAREAATGLVLGATVGLLGLGLAAVWGDGSGLALVVGASLVAVVVVGCLIGGLLPLALQRSGFDPAYASSPFVSSLMDILGVSLYLGIAAALL